MNDMSDWTLIFIRSIIFIIVLIVMTKSSEKSKYRKFPF